MPCCISICVYVYACVGICLCVWTCAPACALEYLDSAVARRSWRAKFPEHIWIQCSKLWICVYFHLYHHINILGGSSHFYPARHVDFVLRVSWFVSRNDLEFVGNSPLDWAWKKREKWCGAPCADALVSVSKYHETLYEGGSRRTLKGRHGRLSAKRTLSKSLQLFVNSVLSSHVAVYSRVSAECRQPVQCHRPCLISLHAQASARRRSTLPG